MAVIVIVVVQGHILRTIDTIVLCMKSLQIHTLLKVAKFWLTLLSRIEQHQLLF